VTNKPSLRRIHATPCYSVLMEVVEGEELCMSSMMRRIGN
jgi:hypothetical protein